MSNVQSQNKPIMAVETSIASAIKACQKLDGKGTQDLRSLLRLASSAAGRIRTAAEQKAKAAVKAEKKSKTPAAKKPAAKKPAAAKKAPVKAAAKTAAPKVAAPKVAAPKVIAPKVAAPKIAAPEVVKPAMPVTARRSLKKVPVANGLSH